jgi:hypothetical protein
MLNIVFFRWMTPYHLYPGNVTSWCWRVLLNQTLSHMLDHTQDPYPQYQPPQGHRDDLEATLWHPDSHRQLLLWQTPIQKTLRKQTVDPGVCPLSPHRWAVSGGLGDTRALRPPAILPLVSILQTRDNMRRLPRRHRQTKDSLWLRYFDIFRFYFLTSIWPCNTPSENSSKSKTLKFYYDWTDRVKISKNPKFEKNKLNIEDVMNFWISKFYKEMLFF